MSRRKLPEVVVRTADGTIIADRCEVADRMLARMKGLLGRKGLEPGGGMLIAPAGSIHMFFMQFPLDVVFLDRAERVVRVAQNVKPWRIALARRARSVIELPAGSTAGLGLEPGTAVVVERPETS